MEHDPSRQETGKEDLMTFEQAWVHIAGVRGWLGNKDQARWMWCEAARARHVIELGSFCGKSAILMGNAMKANGNTQGQIWCVDTFQARNEELADEDTEAEFRANLWHAGLDDIVKVVRGDTKDPELLRVVPPCASLLYIDADHRYEAVLEDVRLWHKHVAATDGQVLFHDYDWPDVKRAIQDAVRLGYLRDVQAISDDAARAWRGCGCGS